MRVAIIGAGVTGLAAAYDLAAAGNYVVIFEASGQIGGLASGFKAPHWKWTLERYYHHWFASDSHLIGLAREMGVESRLIFKRPLTAAYYNGRFYALDSVKA